MNISNKRTYRAIKPNLVSTATMSIALVAVLTLTTLVWGNTGGKVMDVGAIMPDNRTNSSQDTVDLVYSNPKPFELNVLLPKLFGHERKKIEATSIQGPLKIGIHREVPYNRSGDLSSKLSWKKDGGGVVAYVRAHSPDAKSIRFSGHLKLPADSTVTFYETDPSGKINVIDSFTSTKKGFDNEVYWSPHAFGDSIGIEIRLPRPNLKQNVKLELLTIAHRFRTSSVTVINALECSNHEEIQCAIDNEEMGEGNARAALRIIYESDGSSYTCSGTLMNVSADGADVYIPYVITAAHCISTEEEASSLVAWWNYQSESCSGGATSADFSLTYGGADLLVTVDSYDQSLLRLREDPPGGAAFSGWWATDVETGVTGTGAHHPDGAHKKFFSSTTQGNVNVNICDEDDNCTLLVDSIKVRMDNGTSEGGSSGAGLRIYNQDVNDTLFVGVLSGSDQECENSVVYFAEFRHFYDFITTWFDPITSPPESDDDHGDSTATATLIRLISTTEGEIEDAGDVDFFEVVVDRRGTIQVFTSGSLDTVGQLTSDELSVDITDDDSGDSLNFLLTSDVEPGTYYIRVEGYDDSTGNYTLHVEFDENDDHGDTRLSATTVSSSARAWKFSTVGNLEISTDIDVFELSLWYASTITIYTEGDTDTSGLLTDYSGFDLFENDDTDEDNTNFTLSGSVVEGTYFLFVDGSVSEKSEYKLLIDITAE